MKFYLLIILSLFSYSVFADSGTMSLESGASFLQSPATKVVNTSSVSSVNNSPYIGSNDFGTYNVGGYGEIQLGSANSSGLNSGVDNATALRFDFGAKMNSYLGIEGGVTMLNSPVAGNVTAPIQIFDMAVKGYLPLSNWFDLHGQLGVAYANMGSQNITSNGQQTTGVSSSSSDIKALIGLGADIYFTKSFALVINDYNYIGSDQNAGGGNTNVILGGLKYDFQ